MITYTVQRVVSAQGFPGVNTFRHAPGEPEESYIEVAPGGNAVRSYLDIEAPDGRGLPELVAFTAEVAGGPRVASLPLAVSAHGMRLTFGCDLALAPAWREELLDLARYLSQPRTPRT